MIDFTQPIETTETPPRPVRVLFDANGEVYGFDIETNLWGICSDMVSACRRDDNGMGTHFITLRNVAPPEPEPVLREAWVWWASSGKATVSLNEEWCIHQRTVECGVYARVAVMSDGSPVPGGDDPVRYGVCETCVEKSVRRCDELVAERDSLKRQAKEDDVQIEHLHSRIAALKDEVERMRPVVDAAVAWVMGTTGLSAYGKLSDAVRAYQSTPKKTAEEAVANVAKMMAPHKTCLNCRHDKKGGICAVEGPFEFDENGDCQDWEMKND
jgi:hypothetical protein